MTWNEVHTIYEAASGKWINKLDGRTVGSRHVGQGTAIAAGHLLAVRNAADHWIHTEAGSVREMKPFGNVTANPRR